jgi:hypothetical protein
MGKTALPRSQISFNTRKKTLSKRAKVSKYAKKTLTERAKVKNAQRKEVLK